LPLGFQGGWTDPQSGQVNALARWYAPGLASFTTRDSWTLPPDPVAQANRYGYANGSPTNYADTNGHCLWDLCAGELLFLGVVAVVALVGGYVIGKELAND